MYLTNLKDNSELNNWAKLCESCFSEKINPPSSQYFLDHFNLDDDTSRKIESIFVAKELIDDEMVKFEFIKTVNRFIVPLGRKCKDISPSITQFKKWRVSCCWNRRGLH
jgi:hypothetical protein